MKVFKMVIVRCPFREEHLAVCQNFFLYTCHFGEDVPSRHVTSHHVPLPPVGGYWWLLVLAWDKWSAQICSNGPPIYKSIWHLGQDVLSHHVTSHPPPLWRLLVAIGAGLGQMVCSNGPLMYKSIWHLGQDVPSRHVTSHPPQWRAIGGLSQQPLKVQT